MKWIIAVAVFIISCTGARNTMADAKLNGNWELIMFPNSTKTFEEVFGARKPQLQFDVANKKVSGTTGCNHISGSYTRDTTMFRFADNMIMTKMACPGYDENIFLEAMRQIDNFSFVNDQLYFRQDTALVMAFAKKLTQQ